MGNNDIDNQACGLDQNNFKAIYVQLNNTNCECRKMPRDMAFKINHAKIVNDSSTSNDAPGTLYYKLMLTEDRKEVSTMQLFCTDDHCSEDCIIRSGKAETTECLALAQDFPKQVAPFDRCVKLPDKKDSFFIRKAEPEHNACLLEKMETEDFQDTRLTVIEYSEHATGPNCEGIRDSANSYIVATTIDVGTNNCKKYSRDPSHAHENMMMVNVEEYPYIKAQMGCKDYSCKPDSCSENFHQTSGMPAINASECGGHRDCRMAGMCPSPHSTQALIYTRDIAQVVMNKLAESVTMYQNVTIGICGEETTTTTTTSLNATSTGAPDATAEPDKPTKAKKANNKMALLIGLIVVAVAGAIGAIIFVVLRRRKIRQMIDYESLQTSAYGGNLDVDA